MMAFHERMYLRSFMEISKFLSSTLSVNEVLDLIVRQVTDVMSLKGATIRLVNPKTNTLELVAAAGLSDKYLGKGAVDLDKSVTDALSGRPVAIYDVCQRPPHAVSPGGPGGRDRHAGGHPHGLQGHRHRGHAAGDRRDPGNSPWRKWILPAPWPSSGPRPSATPGCTSPAPGNCIS